MISGLGVKTLQLVIALSWIKPICALKAFGTVKIVSILRPNRVHFCRSHSYAVTIVRPSARALTCSKSSDRSSPSHHTEGAQPLPDKRSVLSVLGPVVP